MDQKHPVPYYIRRYYKAFSLGLFVLLITNAIDAIYPLYIKESIDLVVQKAPIEKLALTCFKFLLIMSALAVTRYFWRTIFAKYHTQVAEDVRNRLFEHLLKMGPQFYQKYTVGEIMSVIVNDVQAFRQGIGPGLLILFDGVSILFLVIPIMAFVNWKWTLYSLVLFPLVPLLIYKVNRLIYTRFKSQQDQLSVISGFIQELIGGIKVVKSFSKENLKLNQFNLLSKDLENLSNHVAVVESLFIPVMQFGVASGTVVLIFLAGFDAKQSFISASLNDPTSATLAATFSIGALVAFQRFIAKLSWPMTALGLGLSQYQKGMAAYSRIKEILDYPIEIKDQGQELISKFEKLSIKKLNFKYPGSDQYALTDINFEIKANETLGIIGPIASGKSTLVQLLTRLYDTNSEIFINDIPIEKYQLMDLRKKIVSIPQEPFLFSDTVKENIDFGLQIDKPIADTPEDSADALELLCEQVSILSEIHNLPNSFQTVLGEKGVNLSGGQKQRLTIARALRLPSEVIIFDDNLSAVDYKTESIIQEKVFNHSNKTKIIISHRWSSVKNADKILVLNKGQQEAFGPPKDILSKSATLQQMIKLQDKNHE